MNLRSFGLILGLTSGCAANLPNPDYLENKIRCPGDSRLVTVKGERVGSEQPTETACLVNQFDTPEELCKKTRRKVIIINARPGAPFFYCQ